MKIRTSCSLSSFGSVRYLQDNNWQIYRQNECNTNYNYMSLHVSLSSHKNNFHTGVILLGDAKLIFFRFILVLLRKRLKIFIFSNNMFPHYFFSFSSTSLLTCASSIRSTSITNSNSSCSYIFD